MFYSSRIKKDGTVTIPNQIIESLGLSEGDAICFEIKSDGTVYFHTFKDTQESLELMNDIAKLPRHKLNKNREDIVHNGKIMINLLDPCDRNWVLGDEEWFSEMENALNDVEDPEEQRAIITSFVKKGVIS